MPRSATYQQPEVVHKLCEPCTKRRLERYCKFPNQVPPPYLIPMIDEFCGNCGGTDSISTADLVWVNVHGCGSTGLPVGFAIRFQLRESDREAYLKHWGTPYLRMQACPSCGLPAWVIQFNEDLYLRCAHCRCYRPQLLDEDYFARDRARRARRLLRE
ncbi:MAG TPA: hypothetical protein PLZ57_07390 [Pseudobdellovibrionaceae bacterium]|nr:hypothetical protein [Pseudobdellovibrionaceae bacterium]